MKRYCQLTTTAIRAAFLLTLDSLLRHSLDPIGAMDRSCGLFDCFPILKSAAPQIQMECLLRTWKRWQDGTPADLMDECVVYAAYEALGEASTSSSSPILKVILNGPHPPAGFSDDHWLGSKTRCLQTAGLLDASNGFLGQLEEMNDQDPWMPVPDVSPQIEPQEEVIELIGRWRAEKSVILGSNGLLTADEQDILRAFFEEHPCLVR